MKIPVDGGTIFLMEESRESKSHGREQGEWSEVRDRGKIRSRERDSSQNSSHRARLEILRLSLSRQG